ncbi:5'-nucleotidase [Candidatus Kinetoplastibacterium blastocrithidii TCC012E]|uniref:5'-nucleotidase SurE n=1 Tax=Candidatus Kinetoplastidibacterium blastocrithidiae TCC012E TaxID=1208922 RepID=M1LVW3_9PROT|nr:5'/3'-nucleotidase SurE [Candidatus Kinetoplastibacterium blastocrithidii]AFZ83579.1 5'-nucleotidase [Candidatus Kinetoplastibacterium blastocrithidii (ex Strigomonas culicis)]AGF49697.1 5'-nucleotidase [Candidatus Kinetoplastibacterium blastocrithidii TCC012E]
MHILISNDDGHSSVGLKAAVDALVSIADVTVVAPESNCSGSSNSITLNRPLSVHFASDNYMIINGTPTDCVHLALTGLLDNLPDLVISGINNGANLGNDVLYSGTVGAAREAYMFGIPSIAVSLVEKGWGNLESAAMILRDIVINCIKNPFQESFLWNINIPNISLNHVNGIKSTRIGKRYPSQLSTKHKTPRNETVYWIGPVGEVSDNSDGTDFNAISNNFVSITPLGIDLTIIDNLGKINKWIGSI